MIGEAYELLLERTMHDLHVKDGSPRHEITNTTRRLSNPVTDNAFWLESETDLLKTSLLEMLEDAGDKTTVELKRLSDNYGYRPNRSASKFSDFENLYGSKREDANLKTKAPVRKARDHKSSRKQG